MAQCCQSINLDIPKHSTYMFETNTTLKVVMIIGIGIAVALLILFARAVQEVDKTRQTRPVKKRRHRRKR